MAEVVDIKALAPPGWSATEGFAPCARFYDDMDVLLYLEEDTAYRADRVDPFLTLLWHPERDEAIGVKLKGFRFLFSRIQAILKNDGHQMVKALEVAMTAGLGAVITADAEKDRIREIEEKYERARRLVEQAQAQFNPEELALAA